MAENKVKYNYTDELTGKVWKNEDKGSSSDPDFKGLLCDVGDVKRVTTGEGRDKKIDWARIPGERKKAISIWNNDGVLNVKIAKRDKADDGDFPF